MAHCPICKKVLPQEPDHHPFCSGRCKDIDLGNWLHEEYKVSRPANIDELPEGPHDEEEEETPLLH